MRPYSCFRDHLSKLEGILRKDAPHLADLFSACLRNTLETTVRWEPGEPPHIITGDIPAMWLRDSCFQVRPYLRFIREDPDLASLVAALLEKQMELIRIDPYANAFNAAPDGHGHQGDIPRPGPWVWERKYETNSLCLPFLLATDYSRVMGDDCLPVGRLLDTFRIALDVLEVEQDHGTRSEYRFERPDAPRSESLWNHGKGLPVNRTGMTWSAFRPSDDPCTFGYLVPDNMLAVVTLRRMATLCRRLEPGGQLGTRSDALAEEIDHGIRTYGVVDHPDHGRIFAYETDGFGNYLLMDDANVPSLLSAPYLGYCRANDPVYAHTRRFLLSRSNPYFYEGICAAGIGSRHTPERFIWPISLCIQGLTAQTEEERDSMIDLLSRTDGGTGFMHESFHADRPEEYTRPWFAWANAMFAELVLAGRFPEVGEEARLQDEQIA